MAHASRRNAFTLVELLVVIGVIAILMAIVFPVITTAKLKAYEADCQNNLKQLGTALFNYATSGDNYFPTNTDFTGNQAGLIFALADYMPSNAPTWFCKSEARTYGRDIKNGPASDGVIGYFYWAWLPNSAVDTSSTSNRWNQPVTGVGKPLNTSNFTGQVLFSDRFVVSPAEQYHAGNSTSAGLTTEGTHILYGGGTVRKISPVFP